MTRFSKILTVAVAMPITVAVLGLGGSATAALTCKPVVSSFVILMPLDKNNTTAKLKVATKNIEIAQKGKKSQKKGRCGNGIVEPEDGEQCDDGNKVNGDGCSKTCRTE